MKTKKRRTKICIVGHAENWVTAPWGEDDWDILGFNPRSPSLQLWGGRITEPFTIWADVHQPAIMAHRHRNYVTWLRETTLPIWVYCKGWEDVVPGSLHLNAASVMDLQNAYGEYHCGSFDILVAAALVMGYEEISVVGLDDLSGGSEPVSALECLEFWLGVAIGAGIAVSVPDDARLLKRMRLEQIPGVYGRDQIDMVEYLQSARAGAARQIGIRLMEEIGSEARRTYHESIREGLPGRLQAAMTAGKMSQAELVERAGVLDWEIADFLDPDGHLTPPDDVVVRLARTLNVESKWLKYGEEEESD